MVPASLLTAYLFVTYFLASLLCAGFGDLLTALLPVPAHKLISRGGLILALLGFWPLLKLLHLANRRDLGYDLPGPALRRALLGGFGLGLLILAVLALSLWLLEVRAPTPAAHTPALAKVLAQGLLGGLAVAFLEETFFRGALHTALRRRAGVLAALWLPSLLYAALHFLKPQPLPPGVAPDLASCLTSLGQGFPALFQASHLDGFIALTLVGLFLALVRERTGNLLWGIGLHAGWVLVIKLTQAYTYENPDARLAWLVSEYDGVTGWLAAVWIGVLALGLVVWRRVRTDHTGPGNHL
jgi:membrane protease YdiL (CAAX protease family)